jgi:hypothetical protein
MIPSGIEPATFRLVAQCLKQLRHRVPQVNGKSLKFTDHSVLQFLNLPTFVTLRFKLN